MTQYRNRQNAVDLEDFAALDERQDLWRQTLHLAGIEYVYKHGDDDSPLSETVFSVREAAPALACGETGAHWPAYVIGAKSDRKRLFRRPELCSSSDSLKDAYGRLFRDSLTARELWRIVQISRFVEASLKDRARGEPAADAKSILTEGRWLALHVLLIKTRLTSGDDLNLSQQEKQRLSVAVDTIAQQLITISRARTWGKQYRSVFENQTDCSAVKASLMAALTQTL